MLRPDLYYLAYNKLYRNKGAATKGVDDDTADGFSEEKSTESYNLWLMKPICLSLCAANIFRRSAAAQKTPSRTSILYG